jgi:hypothetical protein
MTRKKFIKFIKEFRNDLENNKPEWENQTLESFLEAMERYTEDIQGYYDNVNLIINTNEPSWENFANILKGSSIYE